MSCLLLHNYCVKRRVPIPQDIVENDGEVDNPAAIAGEAGTGHAVRADVVQSFF